MWFSGVDSIRGGVVCREVVAGASGICVSCSEDECGVRNMSGVGSGLVLFSVWVGK